MDIRIFHKRIAADTPTTKDSNLSPTVKRLLNQKQGGVTVWYMAGHDSKYLQELGARNGSFRTENLTFADGVIYTTDTQLAKLLERGCRVLKDRQSPEETRVQTSVFRLADGHRIEEMRRAAPIAPASSGSITQRPRGLVLPRP